MMLSCCTWALSAAADEILTTLHAQGLRWIDVRPFAYAGEQSRDSVRDLGMSVSCVAASVALPDAVTLGSGDAATSASAMTHAIKGLDHAAHLKASTAYFIPNVDAGAAAIARFALALETLAEEAAERNLRLCIEHAPGRALPTAAGTLQYVRDIGHPNLYLLLDIGHLLITGEDPTGVIESAGDRLGYVHLDDNDGEGDLHLSLLDGVMEQSFLDTTFAALEGIGYNGAVSLELNAALPDPLDAIRRSRQVILETYQDIND
jgi:sugar phosphate isomerase/epimerase